MKFVLMPDRLSAAWFREILAKKGSVGVKVGTFTALLDTIKSLWLLPDIEDVFEPTFKTAVIEQTSAFWAKSIKVDEAATLSEVETSLCHILTVLPLNGSLQIISKPESRIDNYFNDLVNLYESMKSVRPHEQMIAKQWLSLTDSPPCEPLQLIYLPELFAFDVWQNEVIDRLSITNAETTPDDDIYTTLLNALKNPSNCKTDLLQLSELLFETPNITQASTIENIRWLACRDSLQEAEVVVGMVQQALKQGTDLDDIAIVLPHHSDQLNVLARLLNKAGILTSNLHASEVVYQWDIQLIKDLLTYLSWKVDLNDAVSPMSLATILTNPLMPWSLIRGQYYADAHFRSELEKKVSGDDDGEDHSGLLLLLFNPQIDDWQRWLRGIVERLKFPTDARLCSKTKLLQLIDSLEQSSLLYQGDEQSIKIKMLINQLAPKHINLENELSGLVKNGLLLLTESEWLFKPVKHLFLIGFNRGCYECEVPSKGVFSQKNWQSLAEKTNNSVNNTDIKQNHNEIRIKRLLAQPDSSLTILLSQQGLDGEKMFPSETLMDMALCFQPTYEVKPERLIQPISAMSNPSPFFKERAPESTSALTEIVLKDLSLEMDLFKINDNKDGTPRADSPSSLETMMISPLAWLLNRQGLEPKGWEAQNLNVMLKGTIAHKVFELHFDAEIAHSNNDYEALYHAALESEAAFLHQPQWRLERTQLKHEIKEALSPFLNWCESEEWSIHSTEQKLTGALWSLPLKGIADAVFDNGQKTLILDYKKSKSKDRITRLNSGYDLQTVIYRELFNQQEGIKPTSIHSGYYTLNDQKLVLDTFSPTTVDGIEQVRLDVNLAEQSKEAVAKIHERIKQLRNGEIPLNSADDVVTWNDFGIKAEYTIGRNPLVGHFMKPAEENKND